MRVTSYIPETLDKVFEGFKYKPKESNVNAAACIAYEGIVSDEIMWVYQIFEKDKISPRFFGICRSDLENPEENMKYWSRCSDLQLLESDGENYLFELSEPFGITFTQIN